MNFKKYCIIKLKTIPGVSIVDLERNSVKNKEI